MDKRDAQPTKLVKSCLKVVTFVSHILALMCNCHRPSEAREAGSYAASYTAIGIR